MSTFASICVVLDNDDAGSKLLDAIVDSSKECRAKIWYMTMPKGIKDVNTLHTTTCYKNIDKFIRTFDRITPIPATLEGFRLMMEMFPDINLLNEDVIRSFIRYRSKGDRLQTDVFIQTLYELKGKEIGITKTTLKSLAKDAAKQVLEETQEAQEALVAELNDNNIMKEDTHYSYKKITVNGIIDVPFTSFLVKVEKQEMLETGEIISTWVLESEDGKVNRIEVGAAERASSLEFMKKISVMDGFMYRIPPISGFHSLFMYYIEKDIHCPVIKKCSSIGKYQDVWLFNEYGIDKKGEVVYPVENIYALDGTNYLVPQEAMSKDLYRAKINMDVPRDFEEEEVISLLHTLELNQGNKVAWVILGWIGACFIKDKIQQKNWGFPVCYVTGNAQSGKTTLAKWLLKTAGYRTVTALGAKSSLFGINLMSSSYSNLPLWFDDIRGLGEDGIWNTIIISSFENSGDIKGTKDRTLASVVDYKSGMFITSEFFVKSPAAGSRCICLECDDTLQDRQYFDVIERETDRILPALGASAIVRRQKEVLDIDDLLTRYRKLLVDKGTASRFAQNYAIILVGFRLLLGKYIDMNSKDWDDFVQYIVEGAKENDNEISSNSYAIELVKDIGTMLQDRRYRDIYKCGEDWIIRDDTLHLKSSGLYEAWSAFKRINQTGDYNTRKEFIVQLRRLSFATRNSAGTARINGKAVACVSLDLDKMRKHQDLEVRLLPDLLADLDTSEFI